LSISLVVTLLDLELAQTFRLGALGMLELSWGFSF
jgi:hypothetical protein